MKIKFPNEIILCILSFLEIKKAAKILLTNFYLFKIYLNNLKFDNFLIKAYYMNNLNQCCKCHCSLNKRCRFIYNLCHYCNILYDNEDFLRYCDECIPFSKIMDNNNGFNLYSSKKNIFAKNFKSQSCLLCKRRTLHLLVLN
tara:strand:+ start:806 stop:1231 length:426 start_codon:yes stop_codon:yes gene_type:complete